MNTHSLCEEYIMSAPVQLLHFFAHIFCEQWPSSEGDHNFSIAGQFGRVYYMGVDMLSIPFLYHSNGLLLGCILNGTLCTSGTCIMSRLLKLGKGDVLLMVTHLFYKEIQLGT
jgi:hypothetical protein